MTYYDPFLADYLLSASGQGIAKLSQGLARSVNADLISAFKSKHLRIADVATAFDTYTSFTTTASITGYGKVPLAVAGICRLTWMCAPGPRGPNIHANATGYQTIARLFAAKL
jgi:hypothetical protein